jgi:hypothetical protein
MDPRVAHSELFFYLDLLVGGGSCYSICTCTILRATLVQLLLILFRWCLCLLLALQSGHRTCLVVITPRG